MDRIMANGAAPHQQPRNPEHETLRLELEKGRELISKCDKLPAWNVVKQSIYAGELQEHEEVVGRILKTDAVRAVCKLRSSELGDPLPLPPDRVFGMEQPLIEVKEID
ncbi:hypothetical protein EJ110_NYTH16582 [Nymphaea thermarum]|nr:hypothetical protein EJ110_NYTH16582 [Nymphaea thermarum]